MHTLVGIHHPALRASAAEIPVDDILSTRVQKLVATLKDVLEREKFGVAIAAPQVGESVRLFVVSGKTIARSAGEEYSKETYPDKVFINPQIIKTSKKMEVGDEGCLSVPGKYGTKVSRSEKITIAYYDENGTKHQRGASAFLARVFQHEIDHLNGVLYIDNAIEVIDVDENLQPVSIAG